MHHFISLRAKPTTTSPFLSCNTTEPTEVKVGGRHIPCAVHLESWQKLDCERHDGTCLLLLSAVFYRIEEGKIRRQACESCESNLVGLIMGVPTCYTMLGQCGRMLGAEPCSAIAEARYLDIPLF